MFSFFLKSDDKKTLLAEGPRSYIGVAATEYGADFDLFPLIMGQLDERFKTKVLFNLVASSKRFDNFAEAMKQTSRRGVSSNSAFVIGLKCSVDEIDTYREKGELSNLIISITNAITKVPVTENSALLKPKNKDNNNSDRPRSPLIKVG